MKLNIQLPEILLITLLGLYTHSVETHVNACRSFRQLHTISPSVCVGGK